MKRFFSKYLHLIFGTLFIATLVPFFIPKKNVVSYVEDSELFNPSLTKITSVKDAISYIEKSNHLPAQNFDTVEYVKKVTKFVKERFYMGYAHYSVAENWIANVCGKLFWDDFNGIVIPD